MAGWRCVLRTPSAPEAGRLKELESENAQLKRLLANAMFDQPALKSLLAKKF
jgi:putative transposase